MSPFSLDTDCTYGLPSMGEHTNARSSPSSCPSPHVFTKFVEAVLTGASGQLGKKEALRGVEHSFSRYGVGLCHYDSTSHDRAHPVVAPGAYGILCGHPSVTLMSTSTQHRVSDR